MLKEFEGLEVIEAGVEMPNAAGGFQDAMKVSRRELHHADEGYVVVKYSVRKVRFDPIMEKNEDTGKLRRVHVLHAESIAFSDDPKVAKIISDQQSELKRLRDEEAGQGVLT